MEITITSGVDWTAWVVAIATIASGVGVLLTAGVAWVQLSAFRREAQLSRRPVLQIDRVDVVPQVLRSGTLHATRRTLRLSIQNVGEGRAISIALAGMLYEESPTPDLRGLREELGFDCDLYQVLENLPAGETVDVTLDNGVTLPTPETDRYGQPLVRSAWYFADVRYADVYGTTFDLRQPLFGTIRYS